MTNLTSTQQNIPANIEDLSKFVLVGREKLTAVRAEIRAIEKVGLAEEVLRQKKHKARALSDLVLDAEARLGSLMAQLPKAQGGDRRSDDFKHSNAATFEKTKDQRIADLGFTKTQAHRFEVLAGNPKAVEIEKTRATVEDRPVSREKAIKIARFYKALPEEKRAEIDALPPVEAATIYSEMYNRQLEKNINAGIEISSSLKRFYKIEFSHEAITGFLDGCVYDYKKELANLDGLLRGLMALRKELVERKEDAER